MTAVKQEQEKQLDLFETAPTAVAVPERPATVRREAPAAVESGESGVAGADEAQGLGSKRAESGAQELPGIPDPLKPSGPLTMQERTRPVRFQPDVRSPTGETGAYATAAGIGVAIVASIRRQ